MTRADHGARSAIGSPLNRLRSGNLMHRCIAYILLFTGVTATGIGRCVTCEDGGCAGASAITLPYAKNRIRRVSD